MNYKERSFSLPILAVALLLFLVGSCFAETKLLIDFGGTSGQNIFNETDFSGWNTISLSVHTDYTGDGPGGVTMVSGDGTYDNYQSLSGPALSFLPGDTIVCTWYNNSAQTISNWRPIISFTDTDNPSEVEGQPQWYAMDKYGGSLDGAASVNYFYQGETVQTVYAITSVENAPGDAAPTAGDHTVLNISNRNSDYKGLILDKVELVRSASSRPAVPGNITTTRNSTLPHSRIDLSWAPVPAAGGIPIGHYRIYRNNIWVGKSATTTFADTNLESQTNYSYSVEAVNVFKNMSGKSQPIFRGTSSFAGQKELLDPANIDYLGAFLFPDDTEGNTWAYRRGQMAYYPKGDPAKVDGDDTFPGSLYATGHTYDKMAAEFSIPEPVISKKIDDLPKAKTLQDFHAVEPSNSNSTSYNFVGMTYLSENDMFYTTFYYFYNVSFDKRISHGAFTPDFESISGAWWVGSASELKTPPYDSYAKFLGEIPGNWVATNTPGHYLLSGGQRGGGAPNGPSLVALKGWGDGKGVMLPPGGELSYVTLLEYKKDGENTMAGWLMNDYFDGVAWVQNTNGSAVILAGEKSYGEYFYGFDDGTRYYDVINNVPTNHGTTHTDKGGRARSCKAMLLYYNPDDLSRVARSQQGVYTPADELYMEPHEPQPYGAVDIDDYLIQANPDDPSGCFRVESMSYDRERGYLFVAESDVIDGMKDVIHVFHISGEAKIKSNILYMVPRRIPGP